MGYPKPKTGWRDAGPFLHLMLDACSPGEGQLHSGMLTRLIIVAVAGALLLTAPAEARKRIAPGSPAEVTLSFAPIVKRAGPAVVNIYARKVVRRRQSPFLFDDPFFKRFFGKDFPFGGQRERLENSLGSGVIVKANGIIVTNHHVIKGADAITAVLSDRREFEARILIADERTDIAVLRVETEGERLPFVAFGDSDDLEVGDLVLALGNPFGVGRTVTSGIVSALARTSVGITDYRFFIQTDAAINPGNSGGALVDMKGRLVGINTAIFSRNGGSMGIGFAVPSNMVRTIVESAATGRKLVRPWLGLTGKPVTADIASALGLKRPIGVLIEHVAEGGPGDRAGIQQGDVILAIGRHEVEDPQALRFRLATRPIGEFVTMTVFSHGLTRKANFKLIAPPEDPPRNVTALRGRHPLSGASIANLSPALVEEIGFGGDTKGVVILQVRRGTSAQRLGFRPGDIILSIEGREMKRVRDVEQIVGEPYNGWRMQLRRNGRVLNMEIG